ncbi:MAG TPA: ABC transporter permease, partial [Polyangiaceae bacterium]|nr:ABC transporter permease [Polyangiaceae bacterium]
ADEPTGALDSRSGAEVMALLRELAEQGHTVIVVTHDSRVAAAARRVIEIQDGAIVSDTGVDQAERRETSHLAPPLSGHAMWMRMVEALSAASLALRVNPIRTALTLLGVVVGVASVVVLMAVGEGAKQAVLAQLAVFGTNRLYVVPGSSEQRGPGGTLSEADAAIVRAVPGVAAAMPYLKGSVTVRYGNVDHRTNGVAVTEQFSHILNWSVRRGAFFTADDERGLAAVALIGRKLERTLFPAEEDSLRKFVLVDNVPFQVIGVLSEKGALTGDADDDDTIVFPFSTGSQRLFGTPYLSWISVLIQDIGKSESVVDAITAALTERHRIKDFDVYNKAASIVAQTETVEIMTSLLTVTAAVSLLVGGIGVMNIMFMTVTERTREIGIRMASGARRRDILWQFLAEAIVLSGVGGTVGLLLGIAAALGAALSGMAVIFSVRAVVSAFGSAVVTGILFGYLPARRAASLEPVAALARE